MQKLCISINLVVSSIDKNLVENLEETRNEGNLPVDHALRLGVIHPHGLLVSLDTADVCIWSSEYVFQLRELKQHEQMTHISTARENVPSGTSPMHSSSCRLVPSQQRQGHHQAPCHRHPLHPISQCDSRVLSWMLMPLQ
jgi:hypothetical protein